jgi:hypothetical protein
VVKKYERNAFRVVDIYSAVGVESCLLSSLKSNERKGES